jgi:hypothetical protein
MQQRSFQRTGRPIESLLRRDETHPWRYFNDDSLLCCCAGRRGYFDVRVVVLDVGRVAVHRFLVAVLHRTDVCDDIRRLGFIEPVRVVASVQKGGKSDARVEVRSYWYRCPIL